MFNCLNLRIVERQNKKLTELAKNIHNISHLFLDDETILNAFPEKLFVRNHMFSVKISIIDNNTKQALNEINLQELSENTENAFFCLKKTPSMVLFSNKVFCCAILTKKGNINLVGGYSEDEIKYTLTYFLTKIKNAYNDQGKDVTIQINTLDLHNMAISTSIPFTKIDIFNATTLLKEKQIPFKYVPELNDLLTIKPFPITFPSVNIRIFPSGGIFSFGFKSHFEIKLIMSIFICLINPYLRKKDFTTQQLQDWRHNNFNNWKQQEKNKIKRRKKKISNWKSIHIQSEEQNENEEAFL